MICPRCNNQVADGVKFCGTCGALMPQPVGQMPPPPDAYGTPQGAYAPPNQYEEYSNSMFGAGVPKAEAHNPQGPLKIADMTISIDGALVPVADIMLGNQMPIYFEHHILLWKHPGVQIGLGCSKAFLCRLTNFHH